MRRGRKPSPKTRQAARIRRVATRIPWRSSICSPERVPASLASIRAKWNRRTLRPASARTSSGATPGVFPTTRRGGARGLGRRALGRRGLRRSCRRRGGPAAAAGGAVAAPRPRAPRPSAIARPLPPPRARSSFDAGSGARSGSLGEDGREHVEGGRGAASQLRLQLDEPIDHLAPGHDRHLVERQLHLGRRVGQGPRPALLADRHDLEERRPSPACSRTSDRAGEGGQARGSRERSAGPSSSSRRWRAPVGGVVDLTERSVFADPWRSRTAQPARPSAPSAVSR